MRPILAALASVLLGGVGTVAVVSHGSGNAAADSPIVLKLGDQVQVEGQPVGCRVARQNGAVVVDCRRAGALAGTYGTMLSSHKAMIVRFRSNTVGKVVFTATHRGGARRCR
jgi:hypothetical protein